MPRKKKSEFYRLRRKFFLTIPQAAIWFEVTERTIRNWDERGAPRLALRLLQERERRLSSWHPDWAGFKIGHNGKLYGPNRLQLSAEHIRHWPELIRELERLEDELYRLRQNQTQKE
jgi:hypothetical protein